MRVFASVLLVVVATGAGVNVATTSSRRWIGPASATMLYRNVDDRLATKAVVMPRPRPRMAVFGSSRAPGIASQIADRLLRA